MRTTTLGAGASRARRRARLSGAAAMALAATIIPLPATPATASPVQIQVPGLFPTIQGAIDAASAGDVVVVAAGTYHERIDFKGKAVEVRSAIGPSSTTIDGDRVANVVRFHSGEGRGSVLRGFTITHGLVSVTLVGGGIAIENASPTIVGNIVTDNNAGVHGGGGIGVAQGAPLITDNLVTGNVTDPTGAAAGILAVGNAEIVDNRIEGNTAGGGGGTLLSGPVLFRDNVVVGNRALGFDGGGLSVGGGHPRIVQNVISGNYADVRGGGLAWARTETTEPPEIVNNTIVGNHAPSGSEVAGGGGGAVLVNNVVVGGGTASAVVCLATSVQLGVFRHNDVNNGGSAPYAGCPDHTGTDGNLSADPRFVDGSGAVAQATPPYRLQQSSPAVDTGESSASLTTTDFDGRPRVTDGDGDGTPEVDMGAYEADPFARLVPQMPYSVWTQPSGTALDGLGGWVYPLNHPLAPDGQLPAAYLYAHYFGFVSGGALGQVGLVTDSTGKHAVFSVVEQNGTAHNLSVPFAWTSEHFYFPIVTRVGGGSWAAAVYDDATAGWTSIGTLALPDGWGKLAPASVTAVPWLGPAAGSCARYPRADVLFYPPFGFVGGVGRVATLTSSAAAPGDCPPTISTVGPWTRYQVGV